AAALRDPRAAATAAAVTVRNGLERARCTALGTLHPLGTAPVLEDPARAAALACEVLSAPDRRMIQRTTDQEALPCPRHPRRTRTASRPSRRMTTQRSPTCFAAACPACSPLSATWTS